MELAESVMEANAAYDDALRRSLDAIESILNVRLKPEDSILDMGIDSLGTFEYTDRLRTEFQCEVPTTLFFDHPSVAEVARYFASPEKIAAARANATAIAALHRQHSRGLPPPAAPPAARAAFTQLVGRAPLADSALLLHSLVSANAFRRRTDGMLCVLHHAATATIGDGSDRRAALPNETPAHEVALGAFLIDVEPVSVGAYCRFLNLVRPTPAQLLEWCLLAADDPRHGHVPIEQSAGEWAPKAGVPVEWP